VVGGAENVVVDEQLPWAFGRKAFADVLVEFFEIRLRLRVG
jgi:hypothetical protein